MCGADTLVRIAHKSPTGRPAFAPAPPAPPEPAPWLAHCWHAISLQLRAAYRSPRWSHKLATAIPVNKDYLHPLQDVRSPQERFACSSATRPRLRDTNSAPPHCACVRPWLPVASECWLRVPG